MSSKVAILYVVPLIQPVFVTKFDMFAEKGYLHFMSAWWDTLGIVCRDISFWHLVQALFNNPKIKNKSNTSNGIHSGPVFETLLEFWSVFSEIRS